MPKAKKNRMAKIINWIESVNDNHLSFDGANVHCSICGDKEVCVNYKLRNKLDK